MIKSKVLKTTSSSSFEEELNLLLSEGWEVVNCGAYLGSFWAILVKQDIKCIENKEKILTNLIKITRHQLLKLITEYQVDSNVHNLISKISDNLNLENS